VKLAATIARVIWHSGPRSAPTTREATGFQGRTRRRIQKFREHANAHANCVESKLPRVKVLATMTLEKKD
jgi:hypothetical protein